jgi:16S rRNA (cytosine967-C5)-methyltransferase
VYATCSVIAGENQEQTASFLAKHPDFAEISYQDAWRAASMLEMEPLASASVTGHALLLTPFQHNTDGFYISQLQRSP